MASGDGDFSEVHGASQQRDCPGFAPDSLLIRGQGLAPRNQFDGKGTSFFGHGLTISAENAFCPFGPMPRRARPGVPLARCGGDVVHGFPYPAFRSSRRSGPPLPAAPCGVRQRTLRQVLESSPQSTIRNSARRFPVFCLLAEKKSAGRIKESTRVVRIIK